MTMDSDRIAGAAQQAKGKAETTAGHLIPTRLNLDLFEVGIAGEAADALGGERIPGAAEGIDDGKRASTMAS